MKPFTPALSALAVAGMVVSVEVTGMVVAGAAPRTVSAQDGVEQGAGAPPYEMVWAGREEPDAVHVTFDDMAGWRLALGAENEASLRSTTAQVLWGPKNATARLTYRSAGAAVNVVLEPPQAVPVPADARAVELWCYGNNWGWVPDPKTPRVNVSLLLRGSDKKIYRELVTQVRWKEWWLIHRRLTAPSAAKPFVLTGIEIAGAANSETRTLYFESLRFIRDERKPLRFPPRPRRNITLFEGQSPGLNTGPGVLPFPTREETILPANLTTGFSTTYERRTKNAVFRYRGTDGELTYRIPLSFPTGLPRVYARWKNGPEFEVLAGAAVELDGHEGPWQATIAEPAKSETLKLSLRKGAAGSTVDYTFRLWQKSLVWDVACRGGAATELRFGEVGPGERGELLPVPYLTYGSLGNNPPVLMLEPKHAIDDVFVTIWPDWYRSNASIPFAEPRLRCDNKGTLWAAVNGGMRYTPTTDGKRNDLFERVFITVSPCYEEVLPRIPNPPSPHAREAGTRLWQETWGPADIEREKARSRRLRAHGIRHFTQLNHEIAWRDGGESFTLRLKAAPKKGGDEALKKYIEHQQSLGWLAGLYSNYTDFAPVNENWNPDHVQLTADGQLRTAWPRC